MKALFLLLILLIGLVYQAIPYDSEPLSMFPFVDVRLPFKTWVYFLFEHVVLIMLSYIVAYEAKTYRLACKVFFLIQVGDMVDYLLIYNTQWTGFISYNIISTLVMASAIFYEYGRDRY